jgi:GxxExxY protein
MDKSKINRLIMQVYEAAREVHDQCGNGIPLNVFKSCFAHELRIKGLRFRLDTAFPVVYKNIKLDQTLTADFMIEDVLPVNLINKNEDAFEEMSSLLRMNEIPMGLVIEINKTQLVDGFKKIQNPIKRIL